MALRNVKWFLPDEAPESAWADAKEVAGRICAAANRNTSAKVGITYRDTERDGRRVIVIGPRGAAAYPVEFGKKGLRPRRQAKRAIDQARRA